MHHARLALAVAALILAMAVPARAMTALEQPPDPSTLPDTLRREEPAANSSPAQKGTTPTNIIKTPQGIVILPKSSGADGQ